MTGEILVDARALQSRSAVRGIGTYARGLLDGMHQIGEDARIGLLLERGGPPPVGASSWDVHEAARVPAVSRRLQPLLDPLVMTWTVNRRHPALYHALEWAQPLLTRVPVVITVYDLIPFLFGHEYRWMRRERLLALRQLRTADIVIAISESTARDLVTHAGVDRRRIVVTPLAPMQGLAAASPQRIETVVNDRGLNRPWLLAVGTFDPHKRLPLLLDAVTRIRHDHDVDLVITGEQGPYLARVREKIASSGLGEHVHLLGYVEATELAALYTGCACLLFTSAYEGFGIPILEAMRCGAPVACFANSSLPEVAGEAGLVAPEADVAGLATLVAALLGDPAERARRIAIGHAWSDRFSWARTASETVAVYRRLLGEA